MRARESFAWQSLQTTHENTVGDDQSDINRKLHTHIVAVGLENLAHDGDKGRNHDQLDDDSDAYWYGLADDGDDYIGECRDDGYSKSHHNSRLQLGSDG